jgi:hypothetical protein
LRSEIDRRRSVHNRGIGKLKAVVLLNGEEEVRREFRTQFIKIINDLFLGETEIDEIFVTEAPSNSSTSRNEFKRAMLNHRKIILIDQAGKTSVSWKRFATIAQAHTDIKTIMFGIELGEKDIQFSKIENYLLLPTIEEATKSVCEAVTLKKQ